MDNTKPLTSQYLHSASFHKLDKSHFIDSYIHAQRVHAGAHAVEGRTLSSSWQILDNEPSKTPEQAQGHGFGTPILRPRVAKPRKEVAIEASVQPVCEEPEETPERPLATNKPGPRMRYEEATDDKEKHSAQHTIEFTRQTTSTLDTLGKHSLGRHIAAVSAEEHEEQAARLAERRERKRAKRAIVRTDHTENVCDTTHDRTQDKKTKGKQEKKSKIPAGFALMHGFSATNIGKSRLTLTTPGVFNKGKASAKTQIMDNKKPKKKGRHNIGFSEFAFLNNTYAKSPKRKRQSLCTPSASESSSTASTTPAENVVITNRTLKAQKSAKTTEITTNRCFWPVSGESKTTVESDVWDINLENSSSVSKLASENSEIIKEGTVVIDTCGIRCPGAKVVAATRGDADVHRSAVAIHGADRKQTDVFAEKYSVRGGIDINSSPSLGPSQSASQNGRHGRPGSNSPVVTRFSRHLSQPTAEPVEPLAYKHNGPLTATSARDVIWEHLNAFESEESGPGQLDPLEPVSLKSSNICGTSECYIDNPPVSLAIVNHFHDLGHLPNIITSPGSLERAMEEYEAENHIFGAILNEELEMHADLSDDHKIAFNHPVCHNNFVLEPDQEICEDWCFDAPGCQEPHESNGRDHLANRSGKLDWTGVGAYGNMGTAQGNDPLHGNMDDCVTAWELQAASRNYHEAEYLDGKVEFMDYEEDQFEDEHIQQPEDFSPESHNCTESNDLLNPRDSIIRQLETKPGTASSRSSRSDDASNGTSSDNGSLLQQFSQGRVILGLSGHHNGYQTPSKFTTVSRAEADVATGLRGHWLPQKL